MVDKRSEPLAKDVVPPSRRPDGGRESKESLRNWIVALCVALLVAAVIRGCLFTLIRVDGNSMQDTLHDGERLLVTVADVRLGGVDRGDVVICRYPNRGWTNFVKRVAAVPGDTVYREGGVTHVVYSVKSDRGVEIFDEPLDPALVLTASRADDYPPRLLGGDEYFVVGDNRYGSHDSRDRRVGPISGDMIIGRVRRVVWPLSNFRTVR